MFENPKTLFFNLKDGVFYLVKEARLKTSWS
jgi:hypothetical protein